MTAKSLLTVAEHGGPRCCKRNTYLALMQAVEFLKEKFGVTLKVREDHECEFSDLNSECLRQSCPFYSKSVVSG
ncbi:MAG: hypothetical protein JW815_06125 [Candidatus Bathyarchaeota archaeon]|nr:hypothetical protein [Candidatus Bathyarchaeum sp.]